MSGGTDEVDNLERERTNETPVSKSGGLDTLAKGLLNRSLSKPSDFGIGVFYFPGGLTTGDNMTNGWTKTPNEIYAAMAGMCEAELRVTMVVTRATYGFRRDHVQLQYEDFMIEGGLKSRASVAKGIKLMLRRGFFKKGKGQSEYVIPTINSSPDELSEPTESGNSSLNEPQNSSLNEPLQYNKEKKERERKKDARANAFWRIPENLQEKEFLKKWGLWLRHVDEAGLTFTETQAALKIGELSDAGPVLAVQSIDVALSKGWRNIHVIDPVTLNGHKNGRTKESPGDRIRAQIAKLEETNHE